MSGMLDHEWQIGVPEGDEAWWHAAQEVATHDLVIDGAQKRR